MSGSPVRLCMVGAGRHATRNLYPCFALLKNAVVVANADLDLDKARALATSHGIPASYTDYREMVEREQPNGAILCVGPDFHAQTAIELLGRGIAVFTEKPPARDAAQARRVREAWKKSGRVCLTGFKKRFAPAYAKAKAIIDSERFGTAAVLSIFRTSGNYKNTDDPRSQYLLDSGIHVVDLAQWFFGRVARVSAFRSAPSNFAVTLEFAGGAVGTLALTDRMSYARGWEEVTAVGGNGVCVQVDNSVEMIAFEKDVPFAAHKPEFVAGSSRSSIETGFVGELQAFVDAIRTGQPTPSSIDSAVHTMEILEAIGESVATRRTVEVACL
jgi:Predicted dehydrogenases and related proteins